MILQASDTILKVIDDLPNSMPGYNGLPPRAKVHDSFRSPETDLMDMVAHLQLKVDALFIQSGPSTLAMKTMPVQPKPVAFTSTKVPKLSGATIWDLVISIDKCLTL